MLCGLLRWLNVTASLAELEAGDGLQPSIPSSTSGSMSFAAIAAALELPDLSGAERLVSFALASYANRDATAWPGIPAATARAGLSRSRYLQARSELTGRGLVEVIDPGGGRGRPAVLQLKFVDAGPSFDGPVNAQLFEQVLERSTSRGPGRLLLAAIAAMANADGVLEGATTEEIRRAAGLADSTYRRARTALLRSGELLPHNGRGGRGNTNRWSVGPLGHALTRRRRVAPGPGQLSLVASVEPAHRESTASRQAARSDPANVSTAGTSQRLVHSSRPLEAIVPPGQLDEDETVSPRAGDPGLAVADRNPAQPRTVSKGPRLSGVSAPKGAAARTVLGETPPRTPSEAPPRRVRAGREPENPLTKTPQPPFAGGPAHDEFLLQDNYLTPTGRRRQRTRRVDLDEYRRALGQPTSKDRSDWQRIREALRELVGESTFEIWLGQLEFVAVDRDRCLVLLALPDLSAWIAARFSRPLDRCAERAGRTARLASELEQHALSHPDPQTTIDRRRASS